MPSRDLAPSHLSRLRQTGSLKKRANLLREEEGGRGGTGAKSYNSEKAYSSINHPVRSLVFFLSVWQVETFPILDIKGAISTFCCSLKHKAQVILGCTDYITTSGF